MLEVGNRNGKEKETISLLVSRGLLGDADDERTVFRFPVKTKN